MHHNRTLISIEQGPIHVHGAHNSSIGQCLLPHTIVDVEKVHTALNLMFAHQLVTLRHTNPSSVGHVPIISFVLQRFCISKAAYPCIVSFDWSVGRHLLVSPDNNSKDSSVQVRRSIHARYAA